ncbi:urease accessory protein UreF [Microbaculum marinum]|uniref:Urease accessory UreF family protein n=1 Tax=Microbaculum marinum TaxID=1764581 RepID=A0AAW9RKI7_9HYPH
MTRSLLLAMQIADSSFPSGAFAFSWGAEAALADGMLSRGSFGSWLAVEMLQRWHRFDRRVVARAWHCRGGELEAWDGEVDTLFWAESHRARSIRAGSAFLTGAARMDDRAAQDIRAATAAGRMRGHGSVAQGAVFASMGLSIELALTVSAHATAQGLASAAIRLGMISAIDAQRAYSDLRPALADALAPPDAAERPSAFAPISEIAMLRPAESRLFAN